MTNQHRARLAEPQSVSPPPSPADAGVVLVPARPGSGLGPRPHTHTGGMHAATQASMQTSMQVSGAQAGARKHCPVCGERYPADFRVCPRDATALDTVVHDTDPLVGLVLAETYDVLGLIGEGATGRVYEARHTRLRAKHYAIKVMYSDLTRQPAVVQRFMREAEATSVLSHPNIVSALDIGQTLDGRPYIVSELLQGVQLGDYFARCGRLPVGEAVHIVRQACQALIAAHDRGIVHRDIKPGNLFLVGAVDRAAEAGEQGACTVKVLDFGISLVGDASLTKTGMVMGTPAYMPPEQASGTRVDHRADIYALATVMYEALTGCKAFSGADPIATLASVLTREPARPRSLNAEIPPELELVIQKAMSKLPSQRYRSMREFDAALASFDVGVSRLHDATDAEQALGFGVDLDMDLDPDADDADVDADMHDAPAPTSLNAAASGAVDVTDPHARMQRRRGIAWPLPMPMPMPIGRLLGSDTLDHARVRLVWFAIAMGVSILLGLIDATTSGIRLSRGDAPLTGAEIVMSTLGSLGLLIMPTLLFGHYVSARVWSSTPRVLETTRRLRRVLFDGLVTYAAGTLLVRVFASVLANDTGGVASSGWGLFLFTAAALVGLRTCWRQLRRADQQDS